MSSLSLDGLNCKVELNIEADVAQRLMQKRIAELKKNINAPGYRKNNIPDRYVLKRFGGQLEQEVLDQVVGEALHELLQDKNIVPAQEPKQDIESKEIGKPIKIKMDFECLPQFELKDPKSFDITRPTVEITESLINEEIDKLKEAFPIWSAKDKAAAEGDRVRISYRCKIDGEPFNNNELMKAETVIGKEMLFPALEKALVGLKFGDVKEITVDFEQDYPNPNLAGKKGEFDVTITEVEQASPTKVDDAFATRVLGQDKKVADLNDHIKQKFDKQIQEMVSLLMTSRLQDALYAGYEFPLPQILVNNEREARASSKSKEEQARVEQLAIDSDDPFMINIHKALKLGLVAAKHAETNKIDVNEKELADHIIAYATNSGNAEQFFKWFIEDERRVMDARNRLLHQKAVDHLIEAAATKEEKLTFAELEAIVEQLQKEVE